MTFLWTETLTPLAYQLRRWHTSGHASGHAQCPLPIPMLVSSFAITYKSKLWRTKISTKRRLMQGKVPKKTNILLNLASSSGMSGVLT